MLNLLGYIASVIIVVSITFKTTTLKGTIFMRVINALGSLCFIAYGILIKADPTVMANCAAFIINLYYIIIEVRDHRKKVNYGSDQNM